MADQVANVKIWFITGASSGLGRAMTEHLLRAGDKVIATLRKPEVLSDLTVQYTPTQLAVLKVDVQNKTDITAAFATAQEVFGRIDVVYNNAGVAITGELESTDEADARDAFETNFWGAARVTREAVRFFREVNKPVGGRLLQVSSVVGIVGNAAYGYYAASKFALEGLTESLVDELNPAWNIKVTIIEPGPFRTGMAEALHPCPQHPAYADPSLKASKNRRYFSSLDVFDGDPKKAVVVIDRLAQVEDAPLRFPLHKWTVGAVRNKGKNLTEIADKYESWNDDLYY